MGKKSQPSRAAAEGQRGAGVPDGRPGSPEAGRPRRRRAAPTWRGTPEDLQPQVEAALFATADPLSLDDLTELLGAPKRIARSALERLVTEYANRPASALEIGMTADGFLIQVRPLYQRIVDRLLPTDLPQAALRTLTLVAAREPVLQKDIVDARGSAAYDHIKDLVERGLVRKEPKGASFELGIGPRFPDYFRLDRDQLAEYLASLRDADGMRPISV